MNRYFRNIYVATVLFAAVLLSFAVTGASAETVAPNQGTIGTTFTISGSDFGAKRGTVFIGQYPAQLLTWSDTQIECMVKVPMPPGTYDLVVNPQGKAPRLTLYGVFSIMPPTINTPKVRPVFVSPGQQITIGGTFFGSKNGLQDVEIEPLYGEKTPCEIVDWQMDSITFKLPEGILGRFNLEVTNAMGTAVQDWWGTFAPPPNDPQVLQGLNYTGAKAHHNATAVCYQNKLWFFWPGEDHYVYYRVWDGENWSPTMQLVDNVDSHHQSYAPLNPVVVDDTLFLLETRLDGNIHVTKYDPWTLDPSDPTKYMPTWINMRKISVADYSTSGRFAAIYNSHTKLVEIYITTNDTTIDRITYNPRTNGYKNWGALPIQGTSAIKPYLTAVFNGNETDDDYVTYLCWADGNYGYVTELKDGVVLHQTYWWYWQGGSTSGPSLADLGEKYLAVLYSNQYTTYYDKFDKNSHTVVSTNKVPFTSNYSSNWAPNGVVYSTKVADTTSPTGYHMDSKFYAIVANRPHDYIISSRNYTTWQFTECELLGYWMPTGNSNTVDFNGKGDYQLQAEMFPLWPVLGLIDMPPFVRNGNPESTSSVLITDAELDFTLATENGLSGEYSVGPYIESGSKSRVTADVSVGYAGGFDNSLTFTFTLGRDLTENLEGRILGFYLVPRFESTTLEWYDFSGISTGIQTVALQALEPTIKQEAFDPEVGPDVAYYNGECYFTPPYLTVAKTAADIAAHPNKFPMHASDDDRTRLSTYQRDPTLPPFNFVNAVDSILSESGWAVDSPGHFDWQVQKIESLDNGFYCDMKIGYTVAHRIGFGVEGHVKILVHTKTEKTVQAITHFNSQDPISPWTSGVPAVTSFDVDGYWLKPNASGYWVPNNRKGMGDSPWFITYSVPGVYPMWPSP